MVEVVATTEEVEVVIMGETEAIITLGDMETIAGVATTCTAEVAVVLMADTKEADTAMDVTTTTAAEGEEVRFCCVSFGDKNSTMLSFSGGGGRRY